MLSGIEGISVSTSKENFKKMSDFYKNVVGLKVEQEAQFGEDGEMVAFKIGEDNLYVLTHSEVSGSNKEAARFMINIEVDDIEKEASRLKEAGAKQIEPVYHMEEYGYISTFADPDGNYFQVVQVREN